VIDAAVPLAPNQATWALRLQRDKVVAATQGSYDAMFSPSVEGLSVAERLLVALHACASPRQQPCRALPRATPGR
jgi:uncharacterized protein YciW